MALPLRVIQSIRPQASPGVIAGAALVAAVFATTPFLIPDVSARLDVPLGATGILSTAQVASFAVASFVAGRFFRPRRRFHYGGIALLAVSCIASAVVPTFGLLVATRAVAGIGLGTLTWIAWADATRFPRGIGEVAAIAPITAAVTSPMIAWLIAQGGYQWAFVALAVLALAALGFKVDFADLPRIGRTVSRSRSNRLLLIALFLLTVGGSGVFVFAAATGIGFVGISPVNVAWALSINAMAGVLGTRLNAKPRTAGLWLIGAALPALALGNVGHPLAYFTAMALWGFCFWVVIPAAFKLLAEKSLAATERIGDAQALMAVGRVFGPVIGGAAIVGERYGRLSVVGAAFMLTAAAIIGGIEIGRAKGVGGSRGIQ
jgi:predicted MFS family arabinose efflux permease